ncbi:MAG: hypothetical protein EOP53_10785 [Sphingobacteriales bacterium]|nr:MAG: hypothetical protein EOP53_10785 [Sphingobacteriales bacterium]
MKKISSNASVLKDSTVENDTIIAAAKTDSVSENKNLLKAENSEENSDFDNFYKKLSEAFDREDITALNQFIHPKYGIYFVDRPGAIDAVDTAKNIKAFYRRVYLSKHRLKGMYCKLTENKIPATVCDKQYTGCMAEKASNYHRISELKTALLKYGFKENYRPKDDAQLPQFEKLIKRNIANFDKAVGISFLYVDGKWYIGVIDMAKYSCSA